MRAVPAGVTTVECLVAIIILAVGILGATGTTALAIRTAHEGEGAATAARVAGSILDSLAAVAGGAGGCAELAGGADSAATGLAVRWEVTPGPRAAEIHLFIGLPTARGTHADTVWSALPCH